jgi:SAM-dependent methyltransferase
MIRFLSATHRVLALFGFDFEKTLVALRRLWPYLRDLRTLRRQLALHDPSFAVGKLYPCLTDRDAPNGSTDNVYFHQDLLVARRVHANNPAVHVDVGSRIDGFVAHVAAFRAIRVIDVRQMTTVIPNVEFVRMDLMAELPFQMNQSCDSLSCLHALEHFGLGRYGDPVQWNGHLLGLANLARLLKPKGRLYFSVPIGPLRIEFNAHRVFSLSYLLRQFEGKFAIDRFSYIGDDGDLRENVPLSNQEVESNFDCRMGCGIFELIKL